MDRELKKLNDMLFSIFNTSVRMEEEAIYNTSRGDISLTEIRTLEAIGTGRARTMTHVANILGIKVSTLTTAINRLVKKGYVSRFRDEHDRRMVKISLTERGAKAVREHEAFHEAMIREAVAGISEENVDRLLDDLQSISDRLVMRSSMSCAGDFHAEMQPLQLAANVLPVPIVQAGMSIGVAGSRLASAVAMEGGLGLIGTSEIGYRSAGYEKDPLRANLEAIERAVSEARARVESAGGKGLVGAAVMWTHDDAGKYVRAAVKGGAQVIVTSAGLPKDLPAYCQDRRVALLPTISSRRAAAAITRTWTQKYNRTPDGFIFQGPQAAGLLGFRESELEKAENDRYRMIAEIRAELGKLEHCPLIVGGGIAHREDADKVRRYGADGILMGTRFVTTEECDAPEEYKRLYLNCTENDVTIIRSPMKTSARVMRNAFADALAESGRDDYDIIEAVRRGVEGDYENGLIFCGISADRIDGIATVKDVFREFTEVTQTRSMP